MEGVAFVQNKSISLVEESLIFSDRNEKGYFHILVVNCKGFINVFK